MKRILSMVLCAVMMLSLTAYANDSAVVTEESNVEELKQYGIVQGDPDGDMRLSDELTRAEAVTLAVRLCGFTPETSSSVTANEFPDMENHWAMNAAIIAKNLRLTDTESGVAFNPGEKITAQEFMKMLVCILGYKEVAERNAPYPVGYIMQASQIGITNSVPLITDKPLTRGQAVKLICNSLDIPIMVQKSFGKNNEYMIMNGKNGADFMSLRTDLEKYIN